jgi:hypothetical protein
MRSNVADAACAPPALVNHEPTLDDNIFFTESMSPSIMIHRWMKGALNVPDKKRPHPPRMANRRDKFKDRGL